MIMQCLPFMASDRSPSLAQNHSEKSDKWTPTHTKSLSSSHNKKHTFHMQFIVSELQNFPFKVASSRTSNNKHDSVCHICLIYRTTFVIGCSHYCLPLIKFKKCFLSGLKLFSLDGVRRALFLPNYGH